MRSTTEIIQILNERKKVYEEKRKKRRSALSLIAAVAAVVIVMTAIPVGALIIANRANQPAEIPDAELTVSTAQTESFTAENSDNTKTEYSVSIRNVTSSAVKESGVLHGSREVGIAFWTHSGGVEYGDGGKWHRITASIYNKYSPDADRYQADIVVTDGSKELYHITDNGTADVTEEYIFTYIECEIFIPDDMEYGEIYLYFNITGHDAGPIADYTDSPYRTLSVNFFQKYGAKIVRYGADVLPYDREALSEAFDGGIRNTVYNAIEQLYYINNDIKRGSLPDDEKERETVLKSRQRYIDFLTAYKADNEEEYAAIVAEFCENEPKQYDRDGNLIDKPRMRHDPLEDAADGER